MKDTVLIVPGYRGSGAAHWQTWLESSLVDSRRVRGIDWESPVLSEWITAIHREIDASDGQVWIVAHSFGCLASAVIASERAEKVAGVILVAPADPERFSPSGIRYDEMNRFAEASITSLLPHRSLDRVNTVVIASEDDPWLDISQAGLWAGRWGSKLVNVGKAGHINTESGFGPWPYIRDLLVSLQQAGRTLAIQMDSYRHVASLPKPSAISLAQ